MDLLLGESTGSCSTDLLVLVLLLECRYGVIWSPQQSHFLGVKRFYIITEFLLLTVGGLLLKPASLSTF
jgi:hypothetical protein